MTGDRRGDGEDYKVIPSTTVSGTTPIVSAVVDIRDLDSIGFQLITTGTAAGDWTFEASNNFQPEGIASYGQVPTSGDWSDVTALFSPAAVTTASNQFKEANIRARSIRATFTPSAGAGTVRANVNAKSWS